MSDAQEMAVVEIDRGTWTTPNWRRLSGFANFRDAEQWMFRNPQDKPTRARMLDGTLTSYIPFGKLDKSEFS